MRLTGHRCVDKDELGRQYVELTQTAKNFALLLGHADHHAVVSSTDMEGRSPSMSRQQLLLRAFRQCPEPRISLQTAKNVLLGHADHHDVVRSIDMEPLNVSAAAVVESIPTMSSAKDFADCMR